MAEFFKPKLEIERKADKEAVRIKAQYVSSGTSEWKTMAVDPRITSYEEITLLLRKAFDLLGEFHLSYLLPKSPGSTDKKELFLSLLSDWDLDAAFHTASSPCLVIRVENSGNWTMVESRDAPSVQDIRSNIPSLPFKAIFRNEITRTYNKFLDLLSQLRKHPCLEEEDFVSLFDMNGRLINGHDLKVRVFCGGMESKIRKEVWPHLLGVFPQDLTTLERRRFLSMRNQVYQHLKCNWLERSPGGIHNIVHMIQKDVLRTDRNLSFFNVPENHPNLVSLFNILATYCLNNTDVSYCQGMSDVASPFLVVMEDETIAYWCFCALMERLKNNFIRQGCAMNDTFRYLKLFLKRVDLELFNHLHQIAAENLFFCYRMLLLDLKREFPFQEALCVMECIWSTVPPDLSDKESIACFYYKIYQANMPSGSPNVMQWEGLYLKRDLMDENTIPLPHPWLVNSGSPMTLLLCLSILLIHKDEISKKDDFNELGIYFDKLVRQHDASKVLSRAKSLFIEYIKAFLEGQTEDSDKLLNSGCYGTQSDGVQC